MAPGQEARRNGFDPADGSPDARHAMSPNGRWVAKCREGHVVHQVVLVDLVQLPDDITRRLLPQQIIEFDRPGAAFEVQQQRAAVVVHKFGQGLLALERSQRPLNGRPVVGARQHRDVVVPRHLQRPSPAHVRLRSFGRLASVC